MSAIHSRVPPIRSNPTPDHTIAQPHAGRRTTAAHVRTGHRACMQPMPLYYSITQAPANAHAHGHTHIMDGNTPEHACARACAGTHRIARAQLHAHMTQHFLDPCGPWPQSCRQPPDPARLFDNSVVKRSLAVHLGHGPLMGMHGHCGASLGPPRGFTGVPGWGPCGASEGARPAGNRVVRGGGP